MDKEDGVHVYNGILLSHRMERNWVSWSAVDGPRAFHTEWSKSGEAFSLKVWGAWPNDASLAPPATSMICALFVEL